MEARGAPRTRGMSLREYMLAERRPQQNENGLAKHPNTTSSRGGIKKRKGRKGRKAAAKVDVAGSSTLTESTELSHHGEHDVQLDEALQRKKAVTEPVGEESVNMTDSAAHLEAEEGKEGGEAIRGEATVVGAKHSYVEDKPARSKASSTSASTDFERV